MPCYDYGCECGYVRADVICDWNCTDKYVCDKCGKVMERLLGKPKVHMFPEGWWRDLSIEPIYISSRAQLKDECRKHGCYAKYLGNISKVNLDEV